MFSKVILSIFDNPKNAGRIMKPDGIASVSNLQGTANVEFSLRIIDGKITDCNFRAQANPYIIAVCSTITELVKGQMVANYSLTEDQIYTKLGEHLDYEILFCLDCVDMALEDYEDKQNKLKKLKGEDVVEKVAITQSEVKEEGTSVTKNEVKSVEEVATTQTAGIKALNILSSIAQSSPKTETEPINRFADFDLFDEDEDF